MLPLGVATLVDPSGLVHWLAVVRRILARVLSATGALGILLLEVAGPAHPPGLIRTLGMTLRYSHTWYLTVVLAYVHAGTWPSASTPGALHVSSPLAARVRA